MTDTGRGVAYMFLASFLFALMTVFVKYLSRIPVLEIIFFRALIAIVLCLYSLLRARIHVFGKRRGLLILRGLSGTAALGVNFYLIHEVPLATASTLTYLAPIFTTILAIFFVKERVRPLQFVFFVLSFAGVIVIQGFDPRISLLHLVAGITTSILMGVAYNCVRKLSHSEHPLVIMFYFPLMCLPITGVWAAFNWVQPRDWEWLSLLLMGISSQAAQYFLTRSYQLAEVATVSIVNFTGIIYAIVLGYILFAETFNLMTYLGMGLVAAGVGANILFKKTSPKERFG